VLRRAIARKAKERFHTLFIGTTYYDGGGEKMVFYIYRDLLKESQGRVLYG
jgi:hypothetical protein